MNNAEIDTRSIWQRRAAELGFTMFHGKHVSKMTDREIESAISYVSRITGVYYISPLVDREEEK